MSVFAQIDMTNSPGTVVNTIVADVNDPMDSNYTWVDVTSMEPQPCIGWTYDGTNFSSPENTA